MAQACTHCSEDNLKVELAKLLPTCLDGPAFRVWDMLSTVEKSSYDLTCKVLQAAFSRQQDIASFQRLVSARLWQPSESLEVYLADLSHLTNLAFPKYNDVARVDELFRRFVAGLDAPLRSKCYEHGATDVKEALRMTQQAERAQDAARLSFPSSPGPNVVAQAPPADPLSTIIQRLDYLELKIQPVPRTHRNAVTSLVSM